MARGSVTLWETFDPPCLTAAVRVELGDFGRARLAGAVKRLPRKLGRDIRPRQRISYRRAAPDGRPFVKPTHLMPFDELVSRLLL